MSSAYENLKVKLRERPLKWLVTGVAGFIGSNLVEELLRLGQTVTGLDNFSTGHRRNLDLIAEAVGGQYENFRFIEGDIRSFETCLDACKGVEIVLHQAALGSVPRSIDNPIASHESNVDGFLNMLLAAKDCKVKRFVYASSSSVYGDHPGLPKYEDAIGEPLSPYAATKLINEIYAKNIARVYGLSTIGLRYFNVFGPRQDPQGAYAAVIPRWLGEIKEGKPCYIFGDGETSRDFCYIANVVQANLLSGCSETAEAINKAYNIAVGDRTTLKELYTMIAYHVGQITGKASPAAIFKETRAGDVRHSLADISRASSLLGYNPTHTISQGIGETVRWYLAQK